MFELSAVHYSYLGKYPALCGVSLKIPRGQTLAVLGANGTGKSTLLQVLDGLIFPDQGRVYFAGEELDEQRLGEELFARSFRKRVGFVFQNPEVQLFCPTVKEDIAFGPLQLGFPEREVRHRVEKTAELLRIGHLLGRSCHQLSIGEKREVAIATTLATDPEALLLDEPTAGLDPATTRRIIRIINDASAAGKTVVCATHDLHLCAEIAGAACVLGKERTVVASGPCRELLGDHQLLAENNLVHVHAHRHGGTVHTHDHQHLEHHQGPHENISAGPD